MRGRGLTEDMTLNTFSVRIGNQLVDGDTVKAIRDVLKRDFMISHICRPDSDNHHEVVNGQTRLNIGDTVHIIAHPSDQDAICALLGTEVEMDWEQWGNELVTRRILITRGNVNGKTIEQLHIRSTFGANITRVNRSGVDLVATPHLKLQMGDRVTVVGSELAISQTEKVLGNQMRRLNAPNLIPIMLGIVLGCVLANIPFRLPGIPESLRLGLTGGPLIVAILIGYFGPKYNLVTYNTISANLMIRELGICIFLACVGLGTGEDFVRTIATESGLVWIAYGAIITMLPVILGGLIGRYVFHINYYTLMGVLAGANTNPPALAYANDMTRSDSPSVGYSSVYPFAMFLRIIVIQILIFVLG